MLLNMPHYNEQILKMAFELKLMMLFMLVLMTVSLTKTQEIFDREDNLGYLLDATLEDYDPYEGTAKFKCSLDLYIRKTRPAYLYQEAGELSSNGSFPAEAGDRGSNDMIRSGSSGSGGEVEAKATTLHKCEIKLGDGRTDIKFIDVIYMDGYPIVWFQSSKYPEAEVVPYGASFWIVYSALGLDVEVELDFSLCDPRRPGCIKANNQYNEEEYPHTKVGQFGKRTLMRGLALRSGYYSVTASNNLAPRQAYFHLKVDEPVAAIWAREASVTKSSHRVAEGDDLRLSCDFSSPVPYRNKRYWFKNGSYRIQPSDKFTFSNDGGILTLRGVGKSDAGDYRCRIDFSDWTPDIPSLDATTKIEVTPGRGEPTRKPIKGDSCSINLASSVLILIPAIYIMINTLY